MELSETWWDHLEKQQSQKGKQSKDSGGIGRKQVARGVEETLFKKSLSTKFQLHKMSKLWKSNVQQCDYS